MTVVLRSFVPADEPGVAALFAEPAVRQWNPGPDALDPTAWMADNNAGSAGDSFRTWAIADPQDDRLLGTVSAFGWETTPEIGYRVLAAESGRGVASAALAAGLRRAQDELGPTSVRLQHAVANAASCTVATRCGFVLVATSAGVEPYGDGLLYDEHLHRWTP